MDSLPKSSQNLRVPNVFGISRTETPDVGGEEGNSKPAAAEINDAHTLEIEKDPFAKGGKADVFKGEWLPPGKAEKIKVAVKVLRVGGLLNSPEQKGEVAKMDTHLGREMHVWGRLSHERIVPLLGYLRNENAITKGACLLSPLYAFGNMDVYLGNNPNANRLALLCQAAEGLSYLHTREPPIAHLDIKPENILINDAGSAEICDFGLSRVLDNVPRGFTTGPGYTLNFCCPEILNGERGTVASDVFSFAGLILQVLRGKVPYHGKAVGPTIFAITVGKTPPRAEHEMNLGTGSLDALWALLDGCWRMDPTKRPSMEDVMKQLELIRQWEGEAQALHPGGKAAFLA